MATGDDCRVRVTGDPGQEKSVVLRVADLPANVKRAVCVAMRDNETSDTPALGGVMDIVENLIQAARELVTEGNNDIPSLTDIYVAKELYDMHGEQVVPEGATMASPAADFVWNFLSNLQFNDDVTRPVEWSDVSDATGVYDLMTQVVQDELALLRTTTEERYRDEGGASCGDAVDIVLYMNDQYQFAGL